MANKTPNQVLVLHSTVAKHSALAMDVAIAKAVGFSALELSGTKVAAFLDAGNSRGELKELLKGFEIPGMGYLADIERQGRETHQLLKEAESLFTLADAAGAKGVQILTGPINVQAVIDHQQHGCSPHYAGLLALDEPQQLALTASNIAVLADMAKDFGLVLYLESLSWSPLRSLAQQVELLERAGRDNVKLVIDYWHCYSAGDTPESVSRLDKNLIYGVHVCDSLLHDGGVPNEVILRDVPTGSGVLNLQEWTDAVKATGYEGWWSCELFCRKQQQQDSYLVAQELKDLMERLVFNASKG